MIFKSFFFIFFVCIRIKGLEYHDFGHFGFYGNELNDCGLLSVNVPNFYEYNGKNSYKNIGLSANISNDKSITFQKSSFLLQSESQESNNNKGDNNSYTLEYPCGESDRICSLELNIGEVISRPSVKLVAGITINITWYDEEGKKIETGNGEKEHLVVIRRGDNVIEALNKWIDSNIPTSFFQNSDGSLDSAARQNMFDYCFSLINNDFQSRRQRRAKIKALIEYSMAVYGEVKIGIGEVDVTMTQPSVTTDTSNSNSNGNILHADVPWLLLTRNMLDITDREDWMETFGSPSSSNNNVHSDDNYETKIWPVRITAIKSEHVFEHLTLAEAMVALRYAKEWMIPNAWFRIAVPDAVALVGGHYGRSHDVRQRLSILLDAEVKKSSSGLNIVFDSDTNVDRVHASSSPSLSTSLPDVPELREMIMAGAILLDQADDHHLVYGASGLELLVNSSGLIGRWRERATRAYDGVLPITSCKTTTANTVHNNDIENKDGNNGGSNICSDLDRSVNNAEKPLDDEVWYGWNITDAATTTNMNSVGDDIDIYWDSASSIKRSYRSRRLAESLIIDAFKPRQDASVAGVIDKGDASTLQVIPLVIVNAYVPIEDERDGETTGLDLQAGLHNGRKRQEQRDVMRGVLPIVAREVLMRGGRVLILINPLAYNESKNSRICYDHYLSVHSVHLEAACLRYKSRIKILPIHLPTTPSTCTNSSTMATATTVSESIIKSLFPALGNIRKNSCKNYEYDIEHDDDDNDNYDNDNDNDDNHCWRYEVLVINPEEGIPSSDFKYNHINDVLSVEKETTVGNLMSTALNTISMTYLNSSATTTTTYNNDNNDDDDLRNSSRIVFSVISKKTDSSSASGTLFSKKEILSHYAVTPHEFWPPTPTQCSSNGSVLHTHNTIVRQFNNKLAPNARLVMVGLDAGHSVGVSARRQLIFNVAKTLKELNRVSDSSNASLFAVGVLGEVDTILDNLFYTLNSNISPDNTSNEERKEGEIGVTRSMDMQYFYIGLSQMSRWDVRRQFYWSAAVVILCSDSSSSKWGVEAASTGTQVILVDCYDRSRNTGINIDIEVKHVCDGRADSDQSDSNVLYSPWPCMSSVLTTSLHPLLSLTTTTAGSSSISTSSSISSACLYRSNLLNNDENKNIEDVNENVDTDIISLTGTMKEYLGWAPTALSIIHAWKLMIS